jgi:hypothetical protein
MVSPTVWRRSSSRHSQRRNRVVRSVLIGVVAMMLGTSLTCTASGSSATSPDQCSVPLNQRIGGWTCSTPATTASPSATTDSWCRLVGTTAGCWQVDLGNRAYAEFHTNNVLYGFGRTTVGTVNVGIFWKLSGPAIVTKPVQIRNSRPTSTLAFRGYVLNGPVGVIGSVKNTCRPGVYGAAAAGVLRQWTPTGCVIYDNESWDHEQLTQFEWTVPGWTGTWFIGFKSPVAHTEDKELYLFSNHRDLPGQPWFAGWVP